MPFPKGALWDKIAWTALTARPSAQLVQVGDPCIGKGCHCCMSCFPRKSGYCRVSQKNWVWWIVGLTSRLSPSISSDGLENFLFILHGSKKIVKNFQAKIQSATWSKYTLKNTKKLKKSKIWDLWPADHKSIVNNSNQNSNEILMNP